MCLSTIRPLTVQLLTIDCRPPSCVCPSSTIDRLTIVDHLSVIDRPTIDCRSSVIVCLCVCPSLSIGPPLLCVHSSSTVNRRPTVLCCHVSVCHPSLSFIVIHLVGHCPSLSSLLVIGQHAYHIISAVARNGEETQEKKKSDTLYLIHTW